MMKFYDTCSLLLDFKNLKKTREHFFISSITIEELEGIKTSAYKDYEIKHTARELSRFLNENSEQFSIVLYDQEKEDYLKERGLLTTPDNKIIACAAFTIINVPTLVFITNDISAFNIAKHIFNLPVKQVDTEKSDYLGYKEVVPTERQLLSFYQNPKDNVFSCLINEYVILKNEQGEVIDTGCWTGESYRRVHFREHNSVWFGKVIPKSKDYYQMCAFDSLQHNKITLLKGDAATGKSLIAMSWLMSALEKGYIDKIIVFCNTIAVRGAARLGFYPGSRDEKLLDSQIGNFLSSKLGSKEAVQQLIEEEKIVLVPMSDVRGYDTTGMKAGIYITEAQNMSIDLMKLALQRIGDDCYCILDGDPKTQVDDASFSGLNNGLLRVSEVFRNHKEYGEVELKNIYRSKIAEIANKM